LPPLPPLLGFRLDFTPTRLLRVEIESLEKLGKQGTRDEVFDQNSGDYQGWQGEVMKSKTSTAPLPEFFEPMQAKLVASKPMTGAWIYEIKFDGYRALALRGGAETRILSRNQKDLGKKFPTITESITQLGVEDAIMMARS
jgi:ATP-dependent DNA ligase